MANIVRVDVDTGEIKTEPPFVKAYVGHLAKVKGLPPMQTEVLYFLLCNMNYDNTVAITRKKKLGFINSHKTTSQTFSNCISRLATVGFIDIEDVSQYFINPDYFTKSDWSKTKKLVAKWTFSEDGVEFEKDIIDDDGTVIVEAEDPPEKKQKAMAVKSKPPTVDFDLFWSLYPKKVGKKESQKIWVKLKIGDDRFAAISRHLSLAYIDVEKQFIPNPSTYLRGEKWNDEIVKGSAKELSFDSDIPSYERRPEKPSYEHSIIEGELNHEQIR